MNKLISLVFYCGFFLSITTTMPASWCCYAKTTSAIAPTEPGQKSSLSNKSNSKFPGQTAESNRKARRIIGTISQKSSKKSDK